MLLVLPGCELSDTEFDVLPLSTPGAVTGNTQRCHTDSLSLWSCWRVDAAKISNCMTSRLPVCHFSHKVLSISCSQVPVMGLCWSITWPVVFSTRNSVSTRVKSGKSFVLVAQQIRTFPATVSSVPTGDEIPVKWWSLNSSGQSVSSRQIDFLLIVFRLIRVCRANWHQHN